jgi:hypothetical protein
VSLSVESALQNVIAQLKVMTPDQRRELFGELGARYCVHCGYQQPEKGFCQCMNDE